MSMNGRIFGIVGALTAFPRRLAAREVKRRNGVLRRGVTRQTTHVVFAQSLLERRTQAEMEQLVGGIGGSKPMSEAGFLRLLGIRRTSASPALSAQSLLDQSGLDKGDLLLLSLFDAFEHDAEPYSFRDLILAKKYAGLIAAGATWFGVARSVRLSGDVGSLTALTLHAEDEAIYARRGDALQALDGQGLLPLDSSMDTELEELFAAAELAEGEGAFEAAAILYRQCLAIDPTDAVAAFNLGNSLKKAGAIAEAAHAYALSIKLDPLFVEAWSNQADLLRGEGKTDAARSHLKRAIAIDPEYADAIYNLAALEYDAGDLLAARGWWSRYLELDQNSEWSRIAARGIQYVDLSLRKSAS